MTAPGVLTPEGTAWIEAPPAFAAQHLTVRVAGRLSTRFARGERSPLRLVAVIARQFDEHPGNTLALFGSFDPLEKATSVLAPLRTDVPQGSQQRRVNAGSRAGFLVRFKVDDQ